MEDVFLSDDLQMIEQAIWRMIANAVQSYKAPFHAATIATVDGEQPSLRTVILRKTDTNTRVLSFHTDIRSPKVQQLQKHSSISWLFYDPSLRIQLRCYGHASVHYKDEIARLAWGASRLSSQLCYTNANAPGTILSQPELIDLSRKEVAEPELEEAFCHFSVISTVVHHMDWVFLHYKGHRRAIFNYSTGLFQWAQV